MPDEPIPTSEQSPDLPSEPVDNIPSPGQTLTPQDPSPPAPTEATTAEQAPPTVQQPTKPRSKKWLVITIVLIVIIIAAVLAAVVLKSNNKTATVTKKDIPLLTYGYYGGGEIPQYPVTYLYVNVDVDIAMQMFEGLVGYQNQTKVVPLLATSWSTPNDNTWVFNLRHNVKFNTGRTMTAQDVKYSLDYAVANQNSNNGYSTFYFVANKIKQVTVDNTYQVTITTTSPDAVLLNQLGLIGIVDSKAKLGDYSAGTGPYVVKPGTTPTDSTIDLVASNNYWGGHVYTREVKINLYTDPDKLATDSANGKIDLAGLFTPSQLSKIKSYQAINVKYQGLQYMTLNTNRTGSPLQSLTARQAVAYALNIPAILKASGFQGQQASQIVPLILPGHNPTIQNTPYNPSKAKQLLATVANASSPITFAYPAGLGSEGSEITNELNAVGFNVKSAEVADFGTFITNANAGQYDLFTVGDSSATVDGLDILTDVLVNNKNYDNPQIDSLIAAAGDTLNAGDRINDMQEIATIVANIKPDIPLYIEDQVYALTKPYVVTPNLPDLESSAYFWQVYQK